VIQNLSDAVPEYCGSEYFLFLDSAQKEHAETLLAYWCEQIGDDPSFDNMEKALKGVGQLSVPLKVRQSFPDVLKAFFSFLSSTGKCPNAEDWSVFVSQISPQYLANFRTDGSMKGETVRKVLPKVGRNDPCPCGSGKKYKKCCAGLFG
jgi:hypothetical protein